MMGQTWISTWLEESVLNGQVSAYKRERLVLQMWLRDLEKIGPKK